MGGCSNSTEHARMEADFQLQIRDFTMDMVDGIPSVKFSDRVYNFIEKKMETFIVIKLLMRNIDSNALLNKVQMLWKPKNNFQLMDLENNFYLVRFLDKKDLESVVTGESWVIYGHYLSGNRDVINSQVVWIMLPRLSKCFYSECLLKAIGQLIRPMVKIDVNTMLAKRGWFARMAEY